MTSSTYYIDAVTGQRVNTRQNINGEWFVDALNNGTLPAITWTVNADKSTGLTTDDKNFAAVTTPETITLSTDEAAKRGTDDGELYLVSTDKNGEVSYGDPTSDTWQTDTPNKIADGYLIYKQKAQYNIHYIDVNGVEDKTTYAPTDGHELDDHKVNGVGSDEAGKAYYVGDTPDATSKLWSPADYEKASYVFVGLSDNAKGDLLGKQTLTKNVQGQYVYLKHAVKDITPNTPVDDVPKDPDGKRAVDPSDLHKEFTRNITFVADDDAKSPLKDAVPQKVTFDGHVYVDMVTGKTTTPETVKGNDVQVATTKAGNIEWNHDTQTMDEVVQKYITISKGDKYATFANMVGTWHWISGVADEITLKPTSTNPEDLVLVYEKNKGESGPESSYKLPQLDYGESGPSTDYDLPKLDYGQLGPELNYDLLKLDYGQSGPELNYDLPKAEIPSQPTAQPSEQLSEQPAIESNTQLPGEQKNEEPQPMTTQVTTKEDETSIVEPTSSSSTQPTTKQGTQQLPQTGNQKSSSLIGLGFASLLSALGLTKVNKKRKD